MSTKKDALSQAQKAIFRDLGHVMGSVILATHTAPPTDPEAAKETIVSLSETLAGAEESGMPAHSITFYRAVIEAIQAYVDAAALRRN